MNEKHKGLGYRREIITCVCWEGLTVLGTARSLEAVSEERRQDKPRKVLGIEGGISQIRLRATHPSTIGDVLTLMATGFGRGLSLAGRDRGWGRCAD